MARWILPSRPSFVAAVALSLAIPSPAGAQSFIRGDTNGDGKVDISDPIHIMTYLFVDSGTEIPCRASADLNLDGRLDLSDPIYLLMYLFMGALPPSSPFPSCGPNGMRGILSCESPPAACNETRGRLIGRSECKLGAAGGGADLSRECMEWELVLAASDGGDSGAGLLLNHVNAAFNCCPDSIDAQVTVSGNTIEIIETEELEGGGCKCDCLYDLGLEIVHLPIDVYQVKVSGPFTPGLAFDVDLWTDRNGSWCEPRDRYPWQ